MTPGARASCIALAALAPLAPALAGPAEEALEIPRFGQAAELYARNCQGCHGHEGVSVDEVPDLRAQVGRFLHTPAGRDYIVRVPGVAFALIDDAELALTLNWTLQTFSASELPEGWQPFDADEVGRLRRQPVTNIATERAAVVSELVELGVIDAAEHMAFGTERRY